MAKKRKSDDDQAAAEDSGSTLIPHMDREYGFQPRYVAAARLMCAGGATDKDLALAFGCTDLTIRNWRRQHPEFADACHVGKEVTDDRVEHALYTRATGYAYRTEKVFHHQGTITRAETVEQVPPDTAAAFIWLKNRRPDKWRDRIEHDHAGSVTVNITGLHEAAAMTMPDNG